MFRNSNRRMANTTSRVVPRPTAVRRRSSRPFLEALEDRLAPATHKWTGLGATAAWSIAQNWVGGAPAANESNVILQFPPGAAKLNNTNDIANLVVQETDFTASGYTIGGNTITLLGNTTVFDSAPGNTNINLGLNLTNTPPPFVLDDHVFNVASGSTLTLNQPIASSLINVLDFQGQGLLILANSTNSYQGTTRINQGTLRLGTANAVPNTTAVQVGLGATFDLAGFSDTIGSLSNAPSGAGNVNLGGATLTTGANNASTTFTGFFGTGAGGLTKIGTGTFTTTAFWDYTGATNVLGGTLVGAGVASPTSTSATAMNVAAGAAWDLGGGVRFIGSLQGAGTVKFGALTTGQNNQSTTFGGVMQSIFDLAKSGTGTFTMTALLAYTGPSLEIKDGTLRMGGNFVVLGSDVFINPAATFDMTNSDQSIRKLNGGGFVTLGNGVLAVHLPSGLTSTFSGIMSGGGALELVGAGTLVLAGPNTYTGSTNIFGGGTLKLGAANAVPSLSTVFVDSGAFDLNNFNDTIGQLEGAGNVILGSGFLTTGGTNANANFSGTASSTTGQITKVGSGTMILSGSFTNTLSTCVLAGRLEVNGAQPDTGIAAEVAGTAGGFGTVGGFVAYGGSTVNPGTTALPGTLHVANATFNTGSTFLVRLNGTASTDYDQLSVTGALTLVNSPPLPTLAVSLNYNAQTTDPPFTIATATRGISGIFQDTNGNPLPNNAKLTVPGGARFQINYTATTVTLKRVSGIVTHFQVDAVSTSQAGAPFDYTVTAFDAHNEIVNFFGGTVHFSSLDPSATLPNDYTFVPGPDGDNGVHTFSSGATLFRAGTWDVTVTDENAGATSSAFVAVTPAPAVSFAIDVPTSASSGSPFDITVTAQDPYGNTDTNYQGTVTFSSSDTDPGVVLPADYTFQASDNGTVTFPGGVTLITLGDQTVMATDTVSGINGTATVTVATGPVPPRGPGFGGFPDQQALPALQSGPNGLPGTQRPLAPLPARAVDRFFAMPLAEADPFALHRVPRAASDWADDASLG